MRVPHLGQEGHAMTEGRKVSFAFTTNSARSDVALRHGLLPQNDNMPEIQIEQ